MRLHPRIDGHRWPRQELNRGRRHGVAQLAAALVLTTMLGFGVACSPGADPLRPTSVTATPYVAPTIPPIISAGTPGVPSFSTPTTAFAAAGSLFGRWERPGVGVKGQVGDPVLGTSFSCTVVISPGPPVKPISGVGFPNMCEAPEASRVQLNYYEFAPQPGLDLQVTTPDGVTRTRQVETATGVGSITWPILPGDPVGVYQVTATQGSTQGTSLFRVVPAQVGIPRLLVTPDRVAPGQNVVLGVAGFPPRSSVAARLYRWIDGSYWHVAELPTMQTDSRGAARMSLATDPGDVAADYWIVTDPPVDPRLARPTLTLGDPQQTFQSFASVPRQEVSEALIRLAIDDQARVWSEVLARPDLAATSLARIFGESAYTDAIATVRQIRAVGQHRIARLLAPIEIVSARPIGSGKYEILTAERWDDRLYTRDEREILAYPSWREERYVITRWPISLRPQDRPPAEDACPGYCWLVTEHASLRSH